MAAYVAEAEAEIPKKKGFWDILLSEKYFRWTLLIPLLVTLAVFMLYPILYSIYYSFNIFAPGKPTIFVGLENFRYVLHDVRVFWPALFAVFKILVGCLIIELFSGMLIALLLNREFKGQNVVRGLCLLPLLISPLVASLVWNYLLHYDYGFINQVLNGIFHLPKISWWSAKMAVVSIILITSWQWTPFTIFVLLAGLRSLPKDTFEAAKVDGASAWYTFRKLTLPMLSPLILIIIMLRTMWLMRIFDPLYATTRGGAGTETIDWAIFRTVFMYFDIGQGSVIGIITLFITTILAFIVFRLLMRALGVIK
jgi:multiple sugar transport system permease protein